jgi:hypothetical protein
MIELAHGNERLIQLLADEATEGLSWLQQDELRRLLAVHPEVERKDFELAAATATLAMLEGSVQRLPHRVRAKLLANATRFFFDELATSTLPSRPILRTHGYNQDCL